MSKESKLLARQEVFVREYLIDLNATQAAIRAGYCTKNPRNAEKVASELLKKPAIKSEIQKGMDARAKRVEINSDDVLRELWSIARADISLAFSPKGRLRSPGRIPKEFRRAVSSIERFEKFQGKEYVGDTVKLKFWDKIRALELIGRHLKLFSGETIIVNNLDGKSDQELDQRIKELTGGKNGKKA